MAGDWIKVEQATIDKPEIIRTADLLNVSRREALGLFIEFWVWLDKNLSGSCPDFVRHMSKKSLDDMMRCQGFASCLEDIGWAEFDEKQRVMHITNAERHNGSTAKSRALDAKRKKEKRSESVREMSGSQPDENRTREEKRREDKTTLRVVGGFDRFWKTYPNTARKVAKAGCLKAWERHNLEPLADLIVSKVELLKATEQWQRGYEPAPLTFLNQRRWEDDSAPAEPVWARAK